MADDDLIALSEALSPPGPAQAQTTDPLAVRIRSWYLADIQHPLWQRYRKQSKIDVGFYQGGDGQWVDNEGQAEDLAELRRQRRATVAVNHIKPVVKVLTGLERQTRFDLSVLPQGEEDEDDARLMSWLLKFVQQQAHIPEYRSQQFKEGLIRGMSALAVEIDYTDDPVTGEIMVELLTPGEDVIWDPHWTRYDLSDANHLIRFRWAWIEDVIAQYPEQAEQVRAAVTRLNQLAEAIAGGQSTGPIGDAYGSVGDHVTELHDLNDSLYDAEHQRVIVLEAWFATYETRWLVIDKQAGKVHPAPDSQTAHEMARSDPDNLTAVRRLERRIKTATVLPATGTVLEDETDSPYENDAQAYPVVLFVAERVDDEISGIVRDLRDPQRVENKRLSQGLDLSSRLGKIRRLAQENSIAPQSLGDLDDHTVETTIWYRVGTEPPKWDVPAGLPQLVQMLVGLAESNKVSIREISGVNPELQGLQTNAESGIAIARRQAQGQVISTEYFDNHRWTGHLLGQRLGRRIQQKFTKDEYLRLTNDVGASVRIHLNPAELRHVSRSERQVLRQQMQMAGKPPILSDVTKFKYDLVMAETPATPSARAQALNTLLEMVERVPNFMPVLADKIIRLTDGIPDRHEVLQRIAMLQGMGPGGQPPGGPPMLPPGMLPGGPPVPAGPPGMPPGAPGPGVMGVPGTGGETTATVAAAPPVLPGA